MGKKIFYEDALKLCTATQNDSIFAAPNKYGYKININHPKIRPLYERYKRSIKAKILSDAERFDFEKHIFAALERKYKHE